VYFQSRFFLEDNGNKPVNHYLNIGSYSDDSDHVWFLGLGAPKDEENFLDVFQRNVNGLF